MADARLGLSVVANRVPASKQPGREAPHRLEGVLHDHGQQLETAASGAARSTAEPDYPSPTGQEPLGQGPLALGLRPPAMGVGSRSLVRVAGRSASPPWALLKGPGRASPSAKASTRASSRGRTGLMSSRELGGATWIRTPSNTRLGPPRPQGTLSGAFCLSLRDRRANRGREQGGVRALNAWPSASAGAIGRPNGSGPGQVGHEAAELEALSRWPGAIMAAGTWSKGPPGGARGQDQGPRPGPEPAQPTAPGQGPLGVARGGPISRPSGREVG